MSGNLWMFSDQLDDEDALMMQRDFVTYYQGADYYGLGQKYSRGWLMKQELSTSWENAS